MNETAATENDKAKTHFRICEHIKDNGAQCGAPALVGERYCRFHFRVTSDSTSPGDPGYTLPLLETEQSVQIALQKTMAAVISGKLSERKAAILLSGIKAAALLIRQANMNTPKDDLMRELVGEIRERMPVRTNIVTVEKREPAAAGDDSSNEHQAVS